MSDNLKPLSERVDSKEFYYLMQHYRFIPVSDQDAVVASFKKVKEWIKNGVAEETAPLLSLLDECEQALEMASIGTSGSAKQAIDKALDKIKEAGNG